MSQCHDNSSFSQIQGRKKLSRRRRRVNSSNFPNAAIHKSAFCIPRDHQVELKFGLNWETGSSTPSHNHQSSCHWYYRPYMREVWAQRPPLSFYHPFSSLPEVSNSSLMFLSSYERSSHLAGHFLGWESTAGWTQLCGNRYVRSLCQPHHSQMNFSSWEM